MERLIGRLDALPEDYRQVLILAKIEGLSTAAMAERLGKSREAIFLFVRIDMIRQRIRGGAFNRRILECADAIQLRLVQRRCR